MVIDYNKWLRAAYAYYLLPGEDTGMSDYEWDVMARRISILNKQIPYKELPSDYDGGSLFFLKKENYPEHIRKYYE